MALPWENEVLRLAAYIVAAGLVWRYIVVPGWRKIIVGTYRAVRGFFRHLKSLTAEIETIRTLAHETNALTKRELTTNGGSSALDKINALTSEVGEIRRDQALMAGSWVKYAFEHSQEHSGLFVWLKKEHGLDRRQVGGTPEVERRKEQ